MDESKSRIRRDSEIASGETPLIHERNVTGSDRCDATREDRECTRDGVMEMIQRSNKNHMYIIDSLVRCINMYDNLALSIELRERSTERSPQLRDAADSEATRARRARRDGGDTGLADGRVERKRLDTSTIRRPVKEEATSFSTEVSNGKDPVSRAISINVYTENRYAISANLVRSAACVIEYATKKRDTDTGDDRETIRPLALRTCENKIDNARASRACERRVGAADETRDTPRAKRH